MDIENGGSLNGQLICEQSTPLEDTNVNPPHSHQAFLNQWDGGAMDGTCTKNGDSPSPSTCFAFVPEAEADPYFQIAKNYGFANYFFQTNEGPSFPAHQFLISGTSAPSQYGTGSNYTWFDADLTNGDDSAGCVEPSGNLYVTPLIDNSGLEKTKGGDNGAVNYCKQYPDGTNPYCPFSCFNHNTWMSYWDQLYPKTNGWRYYLPKSMGIWAAPTAITGLCVPNSGNTACTSQEYINDMILEQTSPPVNTAPIFNDITNCALAPVSWVIPDKLWSDHATESNDSGPSFVGNIVNYIGLSSQYSGGKCDYWNTQPTAIFVVWDDWGGWFDHINPNTGNFPGVNQTTGTWGAWYTYGFRVPFLVVSPFTSAKTISGYTTTPGGGQKFPFVHDFGSILDFVENNFIMPVGGIGPTDGGKFAGFADHYAPDLGTLDNPNIPLQEFFCKPGTLNCPRPFTQINNNPKYDVNYFQTMGTGDGPDANDSN